MRRGLMVVLVCVAVLLPGAAHAGAPPPEVADAVLDRLLQRFIATPGASPGIAVVVHRGAELDFHTAGVANVETGAPISIDDHMRLASVAKAFSGAAALRLVSEGRLSLNTTIGSLLPGLPAAWSKVNLRQLLQHTSGIPDFSQDQAFRNAVVASLTDPLPPRKLLSFVAHQPLEFAPGTEYRYSNSDNIIVGLMVKAVTGMAYTEALQQLVYGPLGLENTSLPRGVKMPSPTMHGYEVDPIEDVTELIAAGWSWASGGVVSTPRDADRFVRGYASDASFSRAVHGSQFRFIPGSSQPPGPGVNSVGLGIFRYETSCGTVYGHTGNTAGYTQFVAATVNGRRSTVVSVNSQITPSGDPLVWARLHRIFEAAVCAAMAR